MEEEKKKWVKTFAITLGSVFLIMGAIVGITIGIENNNERKRQEQLAIEESEKITLPSVKGMTYKDAKEELEKLGLTVDTYKSTPNDDDIVTSQSPSAEERVKRESKVTLGLQTPVTIESDNFYGMRFKKTISEFCENFNNALESEYNQKQEDTTGIELWKLKSSDFKYSGILESTNTKQYSVQKASYTIILYTENDSDYIVYACVGYKALTSTSAQNFILGKIYPAMVTGLTNIGYDNVIHILSNKITNGIYKDNVFYISITDETNNNLMYVYAMSEEKYNSILNGNANNNQTNDNSAIKTDIQDRIEFFNSYYAWNFHPTNEQMQQMVEFANSTSNFTNDTLADFIIDKGWLPDSGTGTVSSNNSSSTTTNNGNSSSSNKNTSSSSNDDDNTSREVTATVNINLKELIAKNTVATEIKNESERIDIRLYVEDAFVKDDYFEYFSGGASVPNTITTTVKVYENEKKLNDKRKVIITMDNTRTLIKETTLYDGEMIFNKTGTYEIK